MSKNDWKRDECGCCWSIDYPDGTATMLKVTKCDDGKWAAMVFVIPTQGLPTMLDAKREALRLAVEHKLARGANGDVH